MDTHDMTQQIRWALLSQLPDSGGHLYLQLEMLLLGLVELKHIVHIQRAWKLSRGQKVINRTKRQSPLLRSHAECEKRVFLWSRLVNAGLHPNLWQHRNASGAAQMQLQAAAFNENICISSWFAPVAGTTVQLSARSLFWVQP